jgi:Peptidase family S41
MADTVAALAGTLASWIERLMPIDARQPALLADLRERYGDDHRPLTADTCAEVEAAAQRHSRHLVLSFDPDGTATPDDEAKGWPPPDPDDVRRRAGAVTLVHRLPDGTTVVRLDGLEPLALAAPYLDAALTLAAGAEHLVLDLRANGGGDPATVALICGRLLGGESRHLSDVHYRDRVRQWWTPTLPAGHGLPAGCPVDVLTSSATFSSAEALAHHLQVRQRVRVVGEPTRGGADHVTPVQLDRRVLGLLPEAYVVDAVSGTNWERRGVVPDVPCPADDALDVALSGGRPPPHG